MKKIYSTPSVEIIKVQTTAIIAASPASSLKIEGESGTASFIDEGATSEGLSRGGSFWDDEY